MKNKQIKLSWSKKEKDWEFHFPDEGGRNMIGVFFDMTKTTGHKTDWQKELSTMLAENGYDYRTLKITCNKIP